MNLSVTSVIWHICILHLITKGCIGLVTRNIRSDQEEEYKITTRLIDLNKPEDEKLLRLFNISAEEVKNHPFSSSSTEPTTVTENQDRFASIRQQRINDLRNRIHNAIIGNGMNTADLPTHEMAAYPMCSPTVINETAWTEENNLTIWFAPSLFATNRPHMSLDTAVLRLYKLNPNPTPKSRQPAQQNCEETSIEPQIRVTVSTILNIKKNKRERKKRICNNVMLDISQTGWVEIDIKKAISIWEKAERQANSGNIHANNSNNNRQTVAVGWLSIEVHDEEERPLKPGLYFSPPKCSEAYTAIPWNFYRRYALFGSAGMEKVPRTPRIDIKFIDHRSTLPFGYINTHNMHHNHKSTYHHISSSSSPNIVEQTTTNDNLLESIEIRAHRRRHENHHLHHHHHHSDRSQGTTNNGNMNTEQV